MDPVTVCTLDCPDSCSLSIHQDARGTVQIRGNPEHPFTAGFTCAKIKKFIKRLQSPHRITRPLLRMGRQWQTIAWDDALNLCASRIDTYRHDPACILHLHGEGAKGALKQAGKLFFARLGASRIRGSLCDAAGYLACVADFGSRDNNEITDLLHARRIVNWGKDLSSSSIHVASLVRKARKQGARVLSISPGGDGNGPFSDASVRIRPGTDRFLAAAVARLFIVRGLVPREIVQCTNHWQEFRDLVLGRPPQEFASACDVAPDQIEEIFSYYERPEPTATLIGAGLQRYRYGAENVRLINALAVLSGNIGRPGASTYFHLHSLRNVNLGWTKVGKKHSRRALRMPIIGREILEARDPPIRMIWVNGSNFVNQAPDCRQTLRALDSVEFKVVVDAFMTDTAERADLILPCTLMLEEEDVVASYLHDFVHYVRPVLQAPGEAKGDFWIFSELSKRLSPPLDLPDADACMQASLDTPLLDVSLEKLREKSFVRARRPPIAYAGSRFDHPDGKYRFVTTLHEEPPAPAGYPLRLLSLIRRDAIHSQIAPEEQKIPPMVWVATDNQQLHHLDMKRDLFLVSPLGRLKVRLALLPGLHPEVVLYRRGDWMKLGGGVNRLIAAGVTDLGNGAPYYDQYVRLENS